MKESDIRGPSYSCWLQHPVRVESNNDELSAYIYTDSPGFILRDYRYDPILTVDPRNLVEYPDELSMFYAWKIHNELKAREQRVKRSHRRRRNVKTFLKELRDDMISDRDSFYVYTGAVRDYFRDIIKDLLKSKLSLGEFEDRYGEFIFKLDLREKNYDNPSHRSYASRAREIMKIIVAERHLAEKERIKNLLSELEIIERGMQLGIPIITERNE